MTGQAKILIIEDDLDLVEAIRTTLESRDYDVVSAGTGEEGLELVKSEKPDLIILDVMLEDLTKGFHVVYKLKSKDPQSEYAAYSDIPILMLTAIGREVGLEISSDEEYLPVDDFAEKPITPCDLLARVERLLKRKGK